MESQELNGWEGLKRYRKANLEKRKPQFLMKTRSINMWRNSKYFFLKCMKIYSLAMVYLKSQTEFFIWMKLDCLLVPVQARFLYLRQVEQLVWSLSTVVRHCIVYIVLFCISADGAHLLPFAVYKEHNLYQSWITARWCC